jgi:hypothetical protein
MNNIELIKPFLTFESDDDFYVLDIIKRRKENPDMSNNHIDINTYFITSIDELDKIMPMIIGICDATVSRAYINLNVRSFRTIALYTNKKIADILISGHYRSIHKVYNSMCHSHPKPGGEKRWLIDIDWVDIATPFDFKDKPQYGMVKYDLMTLQADTKVEPMLVSIPTLNGEHLITKSFNVKKFRDKYPSFSKDTVKKDSPTLLYFK